ncbi:MAG: flagellar assembly protein FliW, partial [Candidatus Aenigmarchaeota archaeon]|nr:flagellar assembly protein FliW [Candidatus Aenigmarchaeota archaeon]
MKLNTSRFGEIEINDDLIFNFIEPILGYDYYKEFALIDNSPESPFKWLQAVENADIAFPITFPAFFGFDYQFVIPEDKAVSLELKGTENLLSFNIVCIPHGNVQDTTVNLIGPIIINIETKKGMQLVLAETKYSVKHKLFNN